jgi:hypothetical protein
MEISFNELEELNFKEKEYNTIKSPQFKVEKVNFMKNCEEKQEYFAQLEKKCKNIEKNNIFLQTRLEELKKEISSQKDSFLKEEEAFKSEFKKYSDYMN